MEVPLMFISREAFCSYSTVHMDMREIIIHNYGHPVPNMVSNSKHQTIKTKHKTGRSTKLQDVASTLQKPQVIAINHNIPSTPSVQRLWRYLNKCVPCSRVHISFQVWRIGSGCAYGNTDRQDDKYTHDSCMAFTNNEVNVKGGKKRKKKSQIYRNKTRVFSLKELSVQAVRLTSFETWVHRSELMLDAWSEEVELRWNGFAAADSATEPHPAVDEPERDGNRVHDHFTLGSLFILFF